MDAEVDRTKKDNAIVFDYSFVIPVYKNEESLLELLSTLEDTLAGKPFSTEIIFVIDGSPDSSAETLHSIAKSSRLNIKVVTHSRNFGSFAAIRSGLSLAEGSLVGVMSADLQEDPLVVLKLFRSLEIEEADIAFGVRMFRNDPFFSKLVSSSYWHLYRRLINRDIPKGGVDVFACRREVLTQINSMREVNTSLIGLLYWVGYRRVYVEYERNLRKHGKSSWTFKKKLKYMADSVFSFSDLPIRIVRGLGIVGFMFSIFYGTFLVIASIAGKVEVPGYAPIMLAITFGNSSILIALSILGSYLWRVYENSQGRPVAVITTQTGIGAN
jgi:glycosyltransferase involved in cell wall biosynthesis